MTEAVKEEKKGETVKKQIVKQEETKKVDQIKPTPIARPQTSHGRISDQQKQAALLREMAAMRSGPSAAARPHTAATSTKKDEGRIHKKLEILEKIEA